VASVLPIIAIAIVVVILESGPPLILSWEHSPDRDLPLRLDRERFPANVLFELTTAEFSALMLPNAHSFTLARG